MRTNIRGIEIQNFRRGLLSYVRKTVFTPGVVGFLSSARDINSMWQDSAETTRVSAVEQPIGKVLDNSSGTNHVIQATASARPVLSGRVNLLTKSDQFDDAVWIKSLGGTGSVPIATSNTTTAPDGLVTADTVVFALNGGTLDADRSAIDYGFASVVGLPYADSVWMKTNDGSTKVLQMSFQGINAALKIVSPTWTRFTNTLASAADTTRGYRIGLRGAAGTADSANISIWRASRALGTTSSDQRVNTATDYDTVGSPLYRKFDGIDDSLSAATGGGGTAGFFFCAAFRLTGGAGTYRTIFGDRGSGNSGYFVQVANTNRLSFGVGRSGGFDVLTPTADVINVGDLVVATVWDDGANLNMQLGNGTIDQLAHAATVAGNAGITIGKHPSSATEFFPGQIYASVYVKNSGLTASQRAIIKQWAAAEAGIVL